MASHTLPASKHAVEGLSEPLDHEMRQFGIRVALIEPSFAKTNLDLNPPQTGARISEYGKELDIVSKAIQSNVQRAPTPKGDASLLAKLRRSFKCKAC